MTDARELTPTHSPRKTRRLVAIVAALTLLGTAVAPTAAKQEEGFKTSRPAQLVAEPGSGVVIDPIISTGDIVGGYQMSGIPDGLGAWKGGGNTLQVVMNHELGRTFPNSPPGVDTRISKLTLNRKTHGVLAGTYLFNGSEGFERFCSSTLEVIQGTPWYFTGEEAVNAGQDGSSIVMNAETGTWSEAEHFGHLNHENVVPIERLSRFMVVTTDDDFVISPNNPAYLYAYIADSLDAAISGDPSAGSLYVWKATGNPAPTDLAKGQTIPGEFVPIPQELNSNSTELKQAATARGAFRFSRLEDAAAAQQHAGQFYMVDTGKTGESNNNGALYRVDVDPSDPTKAALTLLLDADVGDNINRPDNIDTSNHSVVIQEDGGQNRVLVYDIKSGSVRVVARTPDPQWESSGVLNAQNLLGHGWWLMDVQAHDALAPQPGPAAPGTQPTPSATVFGEDGQLLAVYIPRS